MNQDSNKENELRSLFEELEKGNEKKTIHTETNTDKNTETKREVDILNLPPRKEIHSANAGMHFRVNKPLFRFLFVLFLLIIILIGAYYFWDNELFSFVNFIQIF